MKSGYTILRFVVKRAPDGEQTQEVMRCGDFDDVEQAFDAARMEVLREWQDTVNSSDQYDYTGRKIDYKITDTEWGYEFWRDEQILSRYWVHDTTSALIGES